MAVKKRVLVTVWCLTIVLALVGFSFELITPANDHDPDSCSESRRESIRSPLDAMSGHNGLKDLPHIGLI
jgi:hypothetical protein